MKALKNKILSVLLFTFAFFIVHDHVVVNIYADSKYELSYTEDTISGDVESNIHETIHTSLDLSYEEKLTIQLKLPDNIPSVSIAGLSSHTNLVPQRPPLT